MRLVVRLVFVNARMRAYEWNLKCCFFLILFRINVAVYMRNENETCFSEFPIWFSILIPVNIYRTLDVNYSERSKLENKPRSDSSKFWLAEMCNECICPTSRRLLPLGPILRLRHISFRCGTRIIVPNTNNTTDKRTTKDKPFLLERKGGRAGSASRIGRNARRGWTMSNRVA